MVSVSVDTSSGRYFKVHKQSQYFGNDHDDILLCTSFGKGCWVELDVLLPNKLDVPMADGICRNF